MNKSRETSHFNPPIQIKEDRMLGLTSLEVYNSLFNVNPITHKSEIFTDIFGEFSFVELKYELEAIVHLPGITTEDLADELLAPSIIQA